MFFSLLVTCVFWTGLMFVCDLGSAACQPSGSAEAGEEAGPVGVAERRESPRRPSMNSMRSGGCPLGLGLAERRPPSELAIAVRSLYSFFGLGALPFLAESLRRLRWCACDCASTRQFAACVEPCLLKERKKTDNPREGWEDGTLL